MILSFNVLNKGKIKSSIYEFESPDSETLILEDISNSLLISSEDLILPLTHLLNYLDESDIIPFMILDIEIEEYLKKTFPEINFTKLN